MARVQEGKEKSPVIILPKSERRRKQLQAKLEEYKKRVESFRHPGAQMDTTFKIAVLETLLKNERVETWELSQQLASIYRGHFDLKAFDNACAVIKDYCKTGGKKARGGTGLPALAKTS